MKKTINMNFVSVHLRGKKMECYIGPNKKVKKLCKIEDSTPQPNWTKINCIVKRNNIMSYEIASKQLDEMLDCSTTEQEATEPLKAP